MEKYPRTIENGAGEELTFVEVARDAEGPYLDVRNRVQPGAGPPMHAHHLQEEVLTVESGRMGYQRAGEAPQFAGVGETLTFAPGVYHKFWNAGETVLVCAGKIRPPHNVVFFLSALYASQKAGGGARPDPFDGAFLLRRYRTEFGTTEIPAFVQRFIFPIQVVVGRLLGKYRKYADAPEPIRPPRHRSGPADRKTQK